MLLCCTIPSALAVAEPGSTALLLTILGLLIAVSVLFSRMVDRIGVPVVLLFLSLGMLASAGGIVRVGLEDYPLAVRLGTIALVLILFDGGLNTPLDTVRRAIYPATLLATLGVAITALLVGLFLHLLGLSWSQAMLLGAVVSSTDAAAVLSILRGANLELRPRLGRVLEVESCINDPMAVILTTALIQAIVQQRIPGWSLLGDIPLQLAVGAGCGIVIGIVGRLMLRKAHPPTIGLLPALTLALAFLSYGLATIAHGSGFLAVYATAVTLGNVPLPYRSGLTRIHDALAWMSQVAMFLMLGLMVTPGSLLHVAGIGIALAVFLTLIARPLAVVPCLLPFRYRPVEMAYIGWTGLRGAVPIILAMFPLLAGVDGAERLFNIVFFVVVVTSIVPGSTIRVATRWLGFGGSARPQPSAVLEINSAHELLGDLLSFTISPALAVCGAALSEIEFPAQSAVVLLVRGNELMAARGDTTLQDGDHVYVFCRKEDRTLIELLFGGPEE